MRSSSPFTNTISPFASATTTALGDASSARRNGSSLSTADLKLLHLLHSGEPDRLGAVIVHHERALPDLNARRRREGSRPHARRVHLEVQHGEVVALLRLRAWKPGA